MARIEIGFVTAAAVFARGTVAEQQRNGMRRFVRPESEGEFQEKWVLEFAGECDFALRRLLRDRAADLKTLRAEAGYAWPEYDKGWLRFGCKLVADGEEAKRAAEVLLDPEFAGTYDARLEDASRAFVRRNFAQEMFDEVSVTYHVLGRPPEA